MDSASDGEAMENKQRCLFIIRGLPGSGKTTLAHTLAEKEFCFSADDFFMSKYGFYKYNPDRLSEAHADCERRVRECLMSGATSTACVHNVFSRQEHIEPYRKIAETAGCSVFEITCGNRWKSVHAVPERTISRMAALWES